MNYPKYKRIATAALLSFLMATNTMSAPVWADEEVPQEETETTEQTVEESEILTEEEPSEEFTPEPAEEQAEEEPAVIEEPVEEPIAEPAAEPAEEETEDNAEPVENALGKADRPGEIIVESIDNQHYYVDIEGFTVTVATEPEAFAEKAVLSVSVLENDSDAYQTAEEALKDSEQAYDGMLAFDIHFENAAGEEIEPNGKVTVKFAAKSEVLSDIAPDKVDTDSIQIVHIVETPEEEKPAAAEVVADHTEETPEVKVEISDKAVEKISADFEVESFSTFAVTWTEKNITVDYLSSDGNTYQVNVTCDPEANIPEGSVLSVTEVTEDSDIYAEYVSKTAEALGMTAEDLSYLKLLDISIMHNEEKVQPEVPVQVEIVLLDKDNTEEATKVVHFGEDGVDVITPQVDGDSVNFEAEGFSYYAVTSYKPTANLGGKSYAIIQLNTQPTTDNSVGNKTVYQGRALNTTASSQNSRLSGTTVDVERHESSYNVVTTESTKVDSWAFEAVEGTDNQYNIKAPNGQYLRLDNDRLYLSDTAQALTVTAGTGDNAGKVRITSGYRQIQSSSSANRSSADGNQYFTNGNSNDGNYYWLTLCEISEFDPNQYPEYSGEKISVQDLVDGQNYMIYKNIYNKSTGQYEDWVIDGNGNPVRAYDQGDSLSLHSAVSPWWKVSILEDPNTHQPTGYYVFVNEATGNCLFPTADGTKVMPYDPEHPTSGVALQGRERGDYISTIEKWDDSDKHWYGYEFKSEDTVELVTGKGEHSQTMYFAEEKTSQADLNPVATVDSTAAGITIHMFNYPDRKTIRDVTGSDSYGVGELPKQHVLPTLNEAGYPQFTNGKTGEALFEPKGNNYKGTGNHLFLESVYDSTGYYEYSAFNNFAHYDQTSGNFTVYQETGTPSPTADNFYFHRGNFFPFNELNTNNKANNIYTGNGNLIDYENPSYGDTLYGFSQGTDYYFGMTMDFHFLMPKDGRTDGSPMLYEFNGDDDLWIYIDDVLILDIGGVHDAFAGSINFATGEITGGNGGANGARTIKQCFKNAGVFPDGTSWDDSKVDEYFNGDTFVNYGSHNFKMFYMEHGAGASNLQTRFNLPVIEKGKVTVEKKLSNTTQEDYANVSFAYQLFVQDGTGKFVPQTYAEYEGKTGADGKPVPVEFHDDVKIKVGEEEKTYDNVFYLKPNEAAVFPDIPEDAKYYVQEIGVITDYYDEIYVNDVKIDGETAEAKDGVYRSSEATVVNRARVTFTNHVDEKNANELRITKRLAAGVQDNGDTFEFRVMLENAAGNLAAYYQGTYYIRDDKGTYYRYEGGKLVPNGETPYACTAGNYGTIAGIPADYTVVIKDLLAGTDYYVDEIRIRPNGKTEDVLVKNSEWILDTTTQENFGPGQIKGADVYDYETSAMVKKDSMGAIALGKDAQVTFTNSHKVGDLKITKTVVSPIAADSDEEFDFTVKTDPAIKGEYTAVKTAKDGSTSETTVTFTNGTATCKLKDGESITIKGIMTDVKYTVTETPAVNFNIGKTGDTGTISSTKTATAVFTNTRKAGDLEVTKTVVSDLSADTEKEFDFKVTLSDLTVNGKFGDMTFTNGVATFKLKHDQKAAASGLPFGVTYTVEETANNDFTTEKTNDTGKISAQKSTAAFTNTRKTGELKVKKTVVSDAAADKNVNFTFTVTLSDTAINKTYSGVEFKNGVGTFTLKHDETKTITGLPFGVTYTVAETANNDFTTEKTNDTGTISAQTPTAVFTNTRKTGELEVNKKVISDAAADKNVEFTFTVTLKDNKINKTYSGVEFKAGVGTFTLKDGETKTITGLPTGVEYTVTEANAAGFTLTGHTGDTGTISTTKSEAKFTNTREKGDLKLSKVVVSDAAADKNVDFTFTVTLGDNTISGKYGDMTFANGVATVTLKGGASATATGLPTDVTYTITEAAATGFTLTGKTNDKGTISKTASEAVFTNTRDKGDLEVTKTVVSDVAADKQVAFSFTVTLSDTTINGTYGEGGMTFKDGVATFTLKHGESMKATGLPTGITYTVTEAENSSFSTDKTDDKGTISKTQSTAAFTNTRKTSGLEVKKTVVSDLKADNDKEFKFTVTLGEKLNGTYGGMTFKDGVATFTLKHSETKKATGLPLGVSYTVTEEADTNFDTIGTDTSGTVKDANPQALFTNTRKTGELEVSKKVISDAAADKDVTFTFTVTLSDTTINKNYDGVEFKNGVATFTLKDGGTKKITGLPTSVGYTVTEANTAGFKLTGKTGDSGTISATKSEAKFENTREKGDLEVSKTVISDAAADKNADFTFTVKLADTTINGTYGEGGMTFKDGVATFTLKHGGSMKAVGLPTGVTYTVTEASATGFQQTGKTGDTGTISTTKSEAKFENTRETGDLELSKILVSDRAADADQVFTFTVTLGDTSISGKYGDMTFTDGVAEVKLKGGEKATATGLPTDVTYTITEAEASGFKVTAKTGDTGTISKSLSKASFTNTRDTGDLELSKVLVSDRAADADVKFTSQ